MRRLWLFLWLLLAFSTSVGLAATHNVSTNGQLTTAMAAAVAGDEIVLANGTYTGSYTSGTAGTAESKITIRAANRHLAILQGDNTCSLTGGLTINDAHWIVKDLKFLQHGRAVYVPSVTNVTIQDNIFESFQAEGIRLEFGSAHTVTRNVMAFGTGCKSGGDGGGLALYGSDNNTITDNIIYSKRDNGYTYDQSIVGYNTLIANASDDNTFQGNLLFDGGQGLLRILSGQTQTSGDRNIVRDNAFLFSTAATATDDCLDNDNRFINNIFHSLYFWLWSSKGNPDGTKGNHLLDHNLFWINKFNRNGVALNTGSGCPNNPVAYKINNTFKNNLFYSDRSTDSSHNLLNITGHGASPNSINEAATTKNLFWSPSDTSTWVSGYSYDGADIHASGSQPSFVNAATGDFSLASDSVGKGAATDGADIGIVYNASLKKVWVQNAFALETQENTGLTTSTSFTVSNAHFYHVWFFVPTSPCTITETFTIEGVPLSRNIGGMVSEGQTWLQSGGPARWITLGRHKATDGTLNVSWTTASCANAIYIQKLPNTSEAYQWILDTDVHTPNPPTSVNATTASSSQINLAWVAPTTNTDGSALTDLAGYDIRWCSGAGCTPNQLLASVGLVTSHNVTGLIESTTYCFNLVAKDSSVTPLTSAPSNTDCDTTGTPIPPVLTQYRGFGQATTGGEGKPVHTVTTLTDGVTGSLRNLIGSNRTIKFTVSGTITLTRDIDISGVQNLTIDGFNAPGLIILDRYGLDIRNSSNLIVRNIQIQDARICNGSPTCITRSSDGQCCNADGTNCVEEVGTGNANCTELGNCISLMNSNVGLVFDHVTLISGADGEFGVRFGSNNVTLQNSLILNDNNWGQGRIGVGGTLGEDGTRPRAVTIARNLLAGVNPTAGGQRHPGCDNTTGTTTTCDYRNNIAWDMLNTTASGTRVVNGARVNAVKNYYYDPNSTTDGSSTNNDAIRLDLGTLHTKSNYHQVSGPTPPGISTGAINAKGNSATALSAPEYPTQDTCLAALEILRDAGTKPRSSRAQTIVNNVNLRSAGVKCPTLRRQMYH